MPAFIKLTGHHLSKYTSIVQLPDVSCKLSLCGTELHCSRPVVTSLSGKDEGEIIPWKDGQLVLPANKLVRLMGGNVSVGKYQILLASSPKLSQTGIVSCAGILPAHSGVQDFGITLMTVKQTILGEGDSQFFLVVMD